MPDLVIRIKKHKDGNAALSCERRDGSVTWQRHPGPRGSFFPLHDLTHYAVETALGLREAFWALVADGWNLTDFGKPWPRGPIPREAVHAEVLVGYLDTERATAHHFSAHDFNEHAAAYGAQHGIEMPWIVTDDKLRQLRSLRAELFRRWHELPGGATLELAYDRPRAAAPA